MLSNFSCFCCQLTFFKINFFKKKSFRNTFRVSSNLVPDQDRHLVSPDLGPNCLQRFSASQRTKDSARKERVKFFEYFENLQYLCVLTYLYIVKVISRQQKTALARKELIFCVNILRIYNIHVYLRIGTVWNGPYSLLTRHPPFVHTTSLTL